MDKKAPGWIEALEADIEADMGDVEPGTVFREMPDHDTMEIAIPSDAFNVGIECVLQALAEELTARWYQETAVTELVNAVRKRVAG